MTTMAALLGAVPLVHRDRARLGNAPPARHHHHRRAVVSQILTLYTTPVIYLLLDRLHRRLGGRGPQALLEPEPPRPVPAE